MQAQSEEPIKIIQADDSKFTILRYSVPTEHVAGAITFVIHGELLLTINPDGAFYYNGLFLGSRPSLREAIEQRLPKASAQLTVGGAAKRIEFKGFDGKLYIAFEKDRPVDVTDRPLWGNQILEAMEDWVRATTFRAQAASIAAMSCHRE